MIHAIPTSRAAALTCGLIAIGLHAAAFVGTPSPHPPALEGGNTGSAAQLGTGFEDLVTGSMATAPPQDTPQATPPEPMQAVLPKSPDVHHQVTATPPVARAMPELQNTTIERVSPQPVSLRAAPLMADEVVVQAAATAADRTVPLRAAIRPAKPLHKTALAPDHTSSPQAQPAPMAAQQSVDPAPAGGETASQVLAPSQASPRPAQRPAKPAAAPTAQKGNANRNAVQGGDQVATKTATGRGQSKQSGAAQQGNAASSDYRGKVLRQIERARTQSVNTRKMAQLALTIAPSGQVSNVSLVRSSGLRKLDEVAMAQIRRASPFPPPPGGQALSLQVRIKGK